MSKKMSKLRGSDLMNFGFPERSLICQWEIGWNLKSYTKSCLLREYMGYRASLWSSFIFVLIFKYPWNSSLIFTTDILIQNTFIFGNQFKQFSTEDMQTAEPFFPDKLVKAAFMACLFHVLTFFSTETMSLCVETIFFYGTLPGFWMVCVHSFNVHTNA